eukprot:7825481-Pyramimonas_sp.AAC.1
MFKLCLNIPPVEGRARLKGIAGSHPPWRSFAADVAAPGQAHAGRERAGAGQLANELRCDCSPRNVCTWALS